MAKFFKNGNAKKFKTLIPEENSPLTWFPFLKLPLVNHVQQSPLYITVRLIFKLIDLHTHLDSALTFSEITFVFFTLKIDEQVVTVDDTEAPPFPYMVKLCSTLMTTPSLSLPHTGMIHVHNHVWSISTFHVHIFAVVILSTRLHISIWLKVVHQRLLCMLSYLRLRIFCASFIQHGNCCGFIN